MSNKKARINNILKKIWVIAAAIIIFLAIFSSVFRSLTPLVKEYKKEVEYQLTQLVGQPITIQNVQTGWYWFHPVIKMDHLTIRGKHGSIHLEKLYVGIHLLKSLINWRLQTGLLYLDQAHLVARKKGNEWNLDGIDANNSDFQTSVQQLIAVLAPQERLLIRNVSLDLLVDNNSLIPIKKLNLSVVNRSGLYRIKGAAYIAQKRRTKLEVLAHLEFDPRHYRETQGQIYSSIKNFSLEQLQEIAPNSLNFFEKGTGTVSLWVDLRNGEISALQSHLSLQKIILRSLGERERLLIPDFYANISWKPNSKGWEFQADQIKLRLGDTPWPENKILVQFDKTQQTHLLYAKSLIIESLLPNVLNYFPDFSAPLKTLKPKGNLSDLQMVFRDGRPGYLLTRFDELSWNAANTIPAVKHLSGALQWEPREGHLELDSQYTSLKILGYPQQNLNLLNAGIDWKELSNGWRVSVDHFVLNEPELTVTMQGVFDGVKHDSLGNIHLDLDFSANNVQKWMPYLPKEHMKSKLFNWLNEDVKRIAQVTGKVRINGLAEDFPFDNNKGEFSIVSHAVGGEILITPKWQVITDLEGYLRLKNRDLEIDVVEGNAQGVPLNQINLRIEDIGHDKENLLLHGIIKGQAQKMLNFILVSPLKEKLAKLKMVTMSGMLSTDLRLQIPLYPENDNDLVSGTVAFDNNTLFLKHQIGAISIQDIEGVLSYNEQGIIDSHLTGNAFDYPIDITIHSIKEPEPMTLIAIAGESTIEAIKNKIKMPFLAFLRGSFSIDALLKITANPNDLDNLTITSTLEGLAINLPEPLGKKYKDKTPLVVDLEFNTDKIIRLQSSFNKMLSTNLIFRRNSKNDFEFTSGQIALGHLSAVGSNASGLTVTGILDGFNFAQWKKVSEQISSDKKSGFILDKMKAFNLKFNQFLLLGQQFNNLSIKGTLLPNKDWAVNIVQKKISADVTYQVAKNYLSGFVHYLHLEKVKLETDDHSTFKIKPKEIPNLNLHIEDIIVGDTKIGNLFLTSHSVGDQWIIDYGQIESKAYQFNLGGNWSQKHNTNQTNIQVKLHFNDLAQSLQHWNVTPVVNANKGDLLFNGGWQGAIYDFSLASLNGSMFLQLNEGQITHLSPETEEKLGLGKLLSILSLQTIPRRLKLDFSDLSNQGYSFDIFKGDFAVNKGIITTQNSYIDGPVAYASMKGDLDLIKRTYDLDLHISPHITASLPVVATIAGGPIAGLAAWFASKIISQSMQKITGYTYKISGPWNDPVVQQLNIIKKIKK